MNQSLMHCTKRQQRIKLIAGFRVFTKVLADFLYVNYLLTSLLKNATKLTQTRWQ